MRRFLFDSEKATCKVLNEKAYLYLRSVLSPVLITDRRRTKVELGGERDQYLIITRK